MAVSEKERVVRVKRKRNEAPFESLWLEVSTAARRIKRHEPNLTTLSLHENAPPNPAAAREEVEEEKGGSTKLLFRRIETVSPSGVKTLSLQELLLKAKDGKKSREKQEGRQSRNGKDNKQGQLLAAAKEQREEVSRTARFEQVWRSRRREGKPAEEDDPMRELYLLYDVVRVDVETESAAKAEKREQANREAQLTEGQLLCNYLPLLREHLPGVASEIERRGDVSPTAAASEEYVYDVYTLDEEEEERGGSSGIDAAYPTVQIIDDEMHDWQWTNDPDYDTEDSNAENNSNNDYPEEEDDVSAHGDDRSDSSDVDPYIADNEEYDTVLSDEEKENWRPRW